MPQHKLAAVRLPRSILHRSILNELQRIAAETGTVLITDLDTRGSVQAAPTDQIVERPNFLGDYASFLNAPLYD